MTVETAEYAKSLRRQLEAYARRVADADEVDLAEMVAILDEFADRVGEAATAMSWRTGWAYVASGLEMSPQGARQKFYVRRLARSSRPTT